MTKAPYKITLHGLTVITAVLVVGTCRMLEVNKYSVYEGPSVTYKVSFDDEDEIGNDDKPFHAAWFKESISRDLAVLNYDMKICNPKDSLVPIELLGERFSVEDNNLTLIITNVTLGDTGIYCSAVWPHGESLQENHFVPGYLKVTANEHGSNLPLLTIFVVIFVWGCGIFLFLSIRAWVIEHSDSMKARKEVMVILQAQSDLDV